MHDMEQSTKADRLRVSRSLHQSKPRATLRRLSSTVPLPQWYVGEYEQDTQMLALINSSLFDL